MHGECHNLIPQPVPEVYEVVENGCELTPAIVTQEISANRLALDNRFALPLHGVL
jgi:hypothetical protein